MAEQLTNRRIFLTRALSSGGFLFLGGTLADLCWGAQRSAAKKALRAVVKPPPTVVFELHFGSLRSEAGLIDEVSVGGLVLFAAGMLTGESYQLDGLAEMFPDGPPVAVVVDARRGTGASRALAERLVSSLIDIGSAPRAVRILDGSDADLVAGGYRVVRTGTGPYCHGMGPTPGFGTVEIPAVGRVRLARAAMPPSARRLAVVASLSTRGAAMGPFVIDGALKVLDDASRARALQDPELGARILASPQIGGRIGMVIGEMLAVRFSGTAGDLAEGGGEGDRAIWRADEVLAGRNLFAVERIAHRILSNTRKAHGLGDLAPHPILAAAESLGLDGSGFGSINWRKASL